MSFSMIFSILLIVFFFAAAFVAIKFFLGFQRQASVGLFLDDLQGDIDKAWNSPSSSFVFENTLPSGIKYACFVNLTKESTSKTSLEKEVYEYVKFSGTSYQTNFVLWPIEKAGDLAFKSLKHVQLPSSNPYCIEVKDGKVEIKIDKTFEQSVPSVS